MRRAQRSILIVCCLGVALIELQPVSALHPNVLLIVTDDQGWGDMGCHGNPILKTPHLDRLASESTELTRFYVSPVCSPTRASLMTGRYNYRTGVTDTFMGRSMMAGDEVTIAEVLRKVGYRTGIFGKWHLGDNYPLRPTDQGFEEALVHRGGGIGQPAGPPGNTYFDPVLEHNGKSEKQHGYVSDVLTGAAMRFIGQPSSRPWFTYLAFNCPHIPLQVPEKYIEKYRKHGLDDGTTRIYAMIDNVDENVGRLMRKLEELGAAENTMVVFMTDNGPQDRRYNGSMRGLKGTVFEGGIRVPCLVRWPGKIKAGAKLPVLAAHIDLAPTMAELCGAIMPKDRKIDGRSLAGVLLGRTADPWPERTLFIQWHRGDRPERYRNFAARSARYKLLQNVGQGEGAMPHPQPPLQLYDTVKDPGEKQSLADGELRQKLKAAYDAWFDDMSASRTERVRIVLGSEHENPSILTQQDWHGAVDTTERRWDVEFAHIGFAHAVYDFGLEFAPHSGSGRAVLKVGGKHRSHDVDANARSYKFERVPVLTGHTSVEAYFQQGAVRQGVQFVHVYRR